MKKKIFKTLFGGLLTMLCLYPMKTHAQVTFPCHDVTNSGLATMTYAGPSVPGIAITPGDEHTYQGTTFSNQTDKMKISVYINEAYVEDFWICDGLKVGNTCGDNTHNGDITGGSGPNYYTFDYTFPMEDYCNELYNSGGENFEQEVMFKIEHHRDGTGFEKLTCHKVKVMSQDFSHALALLKSAVDNFKLPNSEFNIEVCEGDVFDEIPLPTTYGINQGREATREQMLNQKVYVQWWKKDGNNYVPLSWGQDPLDEHNKEMFWEYGWQYQYHFDSRNVEYHSSNPKKMVRYIQFYTEVQGDCPGRAYHGNKVKVNFVPKNVDLNTTIPNPHTFIVCSNEGVNYYVNGQGVNMYKVVLPEQDNLDEFEYHWYDNDVSPTPNAGNRYGTPSFIGKERWVPIPAPGQSTKYYYLRYRKEEFWKGGCEETTVPSLIIVTSPDELINPFLEDVKMLDGKKSNPNCSNLIPCPEPDKNYLYALENTTDTDEIEKIVKLPTLPCGSSSVYKVHWMELFYDNENDVDIEKGWVDFEAQGLNQFDKGGHSYFEFCYKNTKNAWLGQRQVDGEWHYTRKFRAYLEVDKSCATNNDFCLIPYKEVRFTLYGDMCEDMEKESVLIEQINDTDPNQTPQLSLGEINTTLQFCSSVEEQVICKDGTLDMEFPDDIEIPSGFLEAPSYMWNPANGGYTNNGDRNTKAVTISHSAMPIQQGKWMQYIVSAEYSPKLSTGGAAFQYNHCILVYKCEVECRSDLDGKPSEPLQGLGGRDGGDNSSVTEEPSNVESSLLEKWNKQVSIYPNPTKGQLNIDFNDVFSGTVEVMTLQGQVVKSITIDESSSKTIEVNSLNPGMYILLSKSNDGTAITKKFLKE